MRMAMPWERNEIITFRIPIRRKAAAGEDPLFQENITSILHIPEARVQQVMEDNRRRISTLLTKNNATPGALDPHPCRPVEDIHENQHPSEEVTSIRKIFVTIPEEGDLPPMSNPTVLPEIRTTQHHLLEIEVEVHPASFIHDRTISHHPRVVVVPA